MKKILGIIIILAMATGMVTKTIAKAERKDQPNVRFVEETLEALGDIHYPEKMSVKRITSIDVGDTYYHVYQGKLDPVGYRIIVFGNYQNYIGFYKSEFPPCNYEIKNHIVIDTGDVDENGEDLYLRIPIDEEKGLPGKLELGGIPTTLERPPKVEGEEEAGPKAAEEDKLVPEFREWTITYKGRELTVSAIYVKQTFAKVFLMAEVNGVTKEFDKSSLSREDRDYIAQFE